MKEHDPEYEESLRRAQRNRLMEAVKDIVGLEYHESELAPFGAALVVWAEDGSAAVFDVDVNDGEELLPEQVNGILVAGLTRVAAYLCELVAAEGGEEEDD